MEHGKCGTCEKVGLDADTIIARTIEAYQGNDRIKDSKIMNRMSRESERMKERLDILLVNKGLWPSREKAKAMIMGGKCICRHNREDKAGSTFDVNANIEVR